MKFAAKAVVILVLLTSIYVSVPVQDQSKVTVTARGIVTNSVTGEPVPRARISLIVDKSTQALNYTVTSGDDGSFAIDRILPGKYLVNVERAGFITPEGFADSAIPSAGRKITVADGNLPSNLIHLPLVRVATVSGRILDSQGEPLSGAEATIYAVAYSYWSGRRTVEPVVGGEVRIARTTKDGAYEITGLRPGEYFLRVTGPTQPLGRPLPIPINFYPGVTAFDKAIPFTLTEGMVMGGIDIKVVPSSVYSIRVKLQSASEITGFRFKVVGAGGIRLSNVRLDSQGDGVYIFRNIPSGEYDIDLSIPSKPLPYIHRIHVFVGDQDVDLKVIDVDSYVTILGVVQVPLGTMPPTKVLLRAVETGDVVASSVGKDGELRFEYVSRGEYTVEVPSSEGLVRSVSYNTRDIPGSFVIDEPSPGPLKIVVDRSEAKLDGIVQDSRNEAVAFGRVVLIPDTSRRTNPNRFLTAVTDETGRFAIENAAPGDYSVLALRSTPYNAYKNLEFLAPFLTRANPVKLRGEMTSAVNLRVIDVK